MATASVAVSIYERSIGEYSYRFHNGNLWSVCNASPSHRRIWHSWCQASIVHVFRCGLCNIFIIYLLPCRIFCIKFHNAVIHIGAKRLVNYVCSITFTLSLFFSVGHTLEMAVVAPEILLNLGKMIPQPASIKTKFFEEALFNKFAFLICLFLNVVEFICFVILFYEMFKHHKRHVDLCLSKNPELANKKMRQNTITTVGHSVSWLAEILIFGVIQYNLAIREDTVYIFFFGMFLPSINYVVFPSVQAMTSQELRAHVFNLKFCKESCLCVTCKSKKEDNDFEIVELHDIPN